MTGSSGGRPSGARTLRAAIVGAGLMGRWHGSAVRHLGHTVSAVHDPDAARAASLAASFGARSASLDEAIEAADVVHVCAPLAAHFAIASRALARGRSVICEKPLATTPAEVRALYELAEAQGALLVPTHQFLFQRGVRALLEARASLGELRHVDLVACTAGAQGRDAHGAEAVAMDVLPHPLSLIERLDPGAIARIDWHVASAPLGELRAIGADGAVSYGILVSCGGRPPVNQFRLIGTRGTATADLFHGFAMIDRSGHARHDKILRPFRSGVTLLGAAAFNLAGRAVRREPAYPGLRPLLAASYEAVLTGGPAPISAAESLAVAHVAEFILQKRVAAH